MRQRVVGLAVGAVLGLSALAGVAYGRDEAPPRTAPAGAPSAGLDLSIRARALGLVPDPSMASPSSLDLAAQRAPTGAGVTRMPSGRIDLGSGMYLEVRPSCLPGLDDFGAPLYPRSRLPRR